MLLIHTLIHICTLHRKIKTEIKLQHPLGLFQYLKNIYSFNFDEACILNVKIMDRFFT